MKEYHMQKFLFENAWLMYLGGALAHYGISIATYAYWIIVIPTILLVAISYRPNEH